MFFVYIYITTLLKVAISMTSEENGTPGSYLGAPSSLIKYESEIEISENVEEYKKARKNQKVLDPKPSPEGNPLYQSQMYSTT